MDCNLFASWWCYCCSQAHSYHARNFAYTSNFDNQHLSGLHSSLLQRCKDLRCLHRTQRGISQIYLPAQPPQLSLTALTSHQPGGSQGEARGGWVPLRAGGMEGGKVGSTRSRGTGSAPSPSVPSPVQAGGAIGVGGIAWVSTRFPTGWFPWKS